MRKLVNRVLFCFLLAVMVWCGALLADRHKLNEELIRLHVVANSDSEEDQAIKLQVRDAITESLKRDLAQIGNTQEAMRYLQNNLPRLQHIANHVLIKAGLEPDAVVTLCHEAFDTRYYDTFTLPAGVYNALRVTLGNGQGHNWWCVVFPTLCQPATVSGFQERAVEAGFSQGLSDALTEDGGYSVRFYLLDAVGKLENMLFQE